MSAPTRRKIVLAIAAVAVAPPVLALETEIWSARDAHEALRADRLRMLDIRSRPEWGETGVAQLAWPVSMHEKGFPERLMAAREIAGGRLVALICSTGGRSGAVLRALRRGGYSGWIDVSEGMNGSRRGKGWIAEGLPVVSRDAALAALPRQLA